MSDEDWRVFDILCGQKVNGDDYYVFRGVVFTDYAAAGREIIILCNIGLRVSYSSLRFSFFLSENTFGGVTES